MNDELLREQINALIRDEIQEVINDYVDSEESTKESGLGFVSKEQEKELKVNVSNKEIDNIISKGYDKEKLIEQLSTLPLALLKKELVITLMIDPAGWAIRAVSKAGKKRTSALEKCIIQKLKSLRFPAPRTGKGVRVTITFLLN